MNKEDYFKESIKLLRLLLLFCISWQPLHKLVFYQNIRKLSIILIHSPIENLVFVWEICCLPRYYTIEQ